MSAVRGEAQSERPSTFGETALQYEAVGYAPVPIPFGKQTPAALTHAQWIRYRIQPEYDLKRFGDQGVGILCSRRDYDVRPTGPAPDSRATFVAGLQVNVRNSILANEIDSLVTCRHGVGPCRVASDGSIFRPFSLARGVLTRTARTRPFYLAADKWKSYYFKPHDAALLFYEAVFVASGLDAAGVPYRWTNGDLLTVPHAALPSISSNEGDALLAEIEKLLESRGARQWI